MVLAQPTADRVRAHAFYRDGHLATFADPDGHLWQVVHAPAQS